MRATSSLHTIIFSCALLISCSPNWAASPLETLQSLPDASLLVVDAQNQILHAKNIDQLFIPASTVKVLTALIALNHWSKDHRFTTDFYLDLSTNYLWVKGYGDPYLVSEELDIIVAKLKQADITKFDGIGVDASYFKEMIVIDGQGESFNPYDTSVSALAANFNTINVRIHQNSISSGESQTPLTSIAHTLSQGLPIGTHRINLGRAELGPKYFAELLKAKLNQSGMLINDNFINGPLPNNAQRLFTHLNSRTLEQIILSMLEFSNNFIANQLYLLLGAEVHHAPATMDKSYSVFANYIQQHFEWKHYVLVEGAGLSTQNRLSAQQLIDVLNSFKPYKHLMPMQNSQILAKSGTLKRVSTYTGYLNHSEHWSSFALMINQKIPYNFRKQVATELLK